MESPKPNYKMDFIILFFIICVIFVIKLFDIIKLRLVLNDLYLWAWFQKFCLNQHLSLVLRI